MTAAVTPTSEPLLPTVCPAALRALPGWLIWRYEGGGDKPRKVPYYAAGGRRRTHGTEADCQRLVPFDVAVAAARKRGFAGVGLATLPQFGTVALDFDHCVSADGVAPEVERLVAGTYAELSPSGRGVRAFMLGDLGNHKSPGQGSAAWGFETFSTRGFVTFTGQVLPMTQLLGCEDVVAPVSPEVRALAQARFARDLPANAVPWGDADPLWLHEPPVGLAWTELQQLLAALDPDAAHDEWLHIGMAVHHETGGEGFELWHDWSAQGSKYPGREVLEHRWASMGRPHGRPVTARYLLKQAQAAGVTLSVLGAASADEVAQAALQGQAAGETPSEPESDAGDVADDFDPVTPGPAPAAATPPTHAQNAPGRAARFAVQPASSFAEGSAPGWIVKGVLPRAELAVLYGESGAGKSFVALDVAMAIARGQAWRERRVKAGRVVYVVAEGGGGFRNRLKAYAQHHGIDLAGVPFGVVPAAPNLLLKEDAIDVARAVLDAGGADVVVVDTFAQVTPGANENGAEDMGRALAHCKGIHRATGALVLLVHHSGKDTSKGARGWSGLRAAADAELEVLRTPAGRMLRVTKAKDGDDTGAWGFDLLPVPVGVDEDGDVVQSCVVQDAPVPVVQAAGHGRKPGGPWQALVAQVVGEMALAQTSGIEVQAVVEEAARRAPAPEEGKRDTRKQHALRALKTLCEGDDAPYWLDTETQCLEVL